MVDSKLNDDKPMHFLSYAQTVERRHIPRNLHLYCGPMGIIVRKVRQLFELIKVCYCRISTCSDIQRVHPTSFTNTFFVSNIILEQKTYLIVDFICLVVNNGTNLVGITMKASLNQLWL